MLRKTYDNCKAVLGNCKIDYTVVLYVNKNNNNGVHLSVHTFGREGSNALSLVDLSDSDLIQTTRFLHKN